MGVHTMRKGRGRRWWPVLAGAVALFFLAGAARAQDGVKVTANLSSGVVKVGASVSISLVVEGTHDAEIVAIPDVEGLRLGPPSGGVQSTRVYNGRRWIGITWNIPVRAAKEGVYQIPGLTVRAAGRERTTRPLALKAVADLEGADLGFFEIHAVPSPVVEGQPFTLELTFGWDQEWNPPGSRREKPFASLSLPWWDDLPGTVELEGTGDEGAAGRVTLLVNERVEVSVDALDPVVRDGRTFRAFRLRRHLLPARSGELAFPTSFFEFGLLREGRSLFNPRNEIVERYFVEAPAFALEVVPLPTEGQPLGYSGAVGTLEVRARADTRDVVVGDSIKFVVDWTGKGNLEFFDTPDPGLLDAFDGFRVYGKTEERSFERRRTTYDLAPLSADVDEIPSLPLTVFDPGRGEYVTIETAPIPIRVRPLAGAVELGAENEGEGLGEDIRDIDTRPLGGGEPGNSSAPGDGATGAIALGVPLLLLGARTLVRRRRGDPAAPRERRRRRARRVLRRALVRADSPRGDLDAFLSFLAARTREEREAWDGRAVLAWHAGGGEETCPLSRSAVLDLDRLLRRLEAAVYGGAPRVDGAELLRAARRLVEEGM